MSDPRRITLLDGGTGTELRARGAPVPSHTTSIWSAQALIDAPDSVVEVHRDYIAAGCDVITSNNYAVTPPLLSRAGLEHRVEELTTLAVDLAARARDTAGTPVRIAGSLPPLDTSYRADLVGDDDANLAAYRRIAAALAPGVDLFLCETLASAREARAAVTAARECGAPVWVSWTLQGNVENQLPSGEPLEDAFAALSDLPVDGYLVNCCGANLVTAAMKPLAELTRETGRPFGGYAHTATVEVSADGSRAPLESLSYHALDVDGYTDTVRGWIEAGASLVGGCCSTRPAHIARLRRLIDDIG